jgi:hypothetical protein
MNYLIFDIECCDGKHICEFGYVLFTEEFELLVRECITINPEYPFKLSGREHESDIQLAFCEEVYFNSPTYEDLYDKIKGIIETPDCQIIGFSMKNDVTFLNTANDIYEKDEFEFTYLDFQVLYQAYTNSENRTSVEKCVKELGIEDIILHKSDDDSYAIMLALKKICEKENLPLPEMLKMLKQLKGGYFAEKAKARNLMLIDKIESGGLKAQKEFLGGFISKLKVDKRATNPFFAGKAICISQNYQRANFNQMLSLLEILYSVGAFYRAKASECDIFILTEGYEEDLRYIRAKQAVEEGGTIEFIALSKILEKLSISEEQLSKKNYVRETLSKKKQRSYQESKPSTLGELLKAKGIDLSNIV